MAKNLNRDPFVAHLVPALFRREGGILGGAERYAFQLAKFMSREVRTRLVTFGPKAEQYSEAGLEIRVCPVMAYIKGNRGNPFSLNALTHLSHADVVHCHQKHIVMTSLAALAARIRGKKVFVTDLGGGGWDLSAYMSTDAWFNGELHISDYSRKVSNKTARQHVIWGGVDTEVFAPRESQEKGDTVLFVGRLLPHKGIDVLIKASDPKTPLKIIGEAYDRHYLRDLEELASGKNIEFCHAVDDRELIQDYRKAKVVVLPSVYRDLYGQKTRVPELLGQTLLEAMACGTPVIATDVASLPEIVRDRIDGFLVPPNDPEALRAKLHWFDQNPRETALMGKRAREHVLEKFGWPQVVKRCLDIYGMDRK